MTRNKLPAKTPAVCKGKTPIRKTAPMPDNAGCLPGTRPDSITVSVDWRNGVSSDTVFVCYPDPPSGPNCWSANWYDTSYAAQRILLEINQDSITAELVWGWITQASRALPPVRDCTTGIIGELTTTAYNGYGLSPVVTITQA